ncbi:MAG TPA: hypothetical protein VM143_14135 [Acidimicrobiales bacterium]|nr:hypothetical protein [Acidimicrobiales bacterium]
MNPRAAVDLPLSILLARAIVVLSERADATTGVAQSLPVWCNVLQYVDADGVFLRDMPNRSCLSKRALIVAYNRLRKLGFGDVDRGGAAKRVRLTRAGVAARAGVWRPVDPGGVEGLRSGLTAIVGALELELPHYPTQYGTADCSIRGGPGQDWKPVPRLASSVGSLPLIALLAQAFIAFAIDYESRLGALASSALVLSHVPDEGLDVSALPPGISGVVSALERHGGLKITSEKPPRIQLTAGGARWRDSHPKALEQIETEWQARHGGDVIDGVRGGLHALVASSPDVDVSEVHHPPTAALFGMGRWA